MYVCVFSYTMFDGTLENICLLFGDEISVVTFT